MARERMKKFSALVGMIAVTSMLVVFFLAVPSFLTTTAGIAFSLAWFVIAMATLTGFGTRVFQRQQRKRAVAPSHWQGITARMMSKPGRTRRQRGMSF